MAVIALPGGQTCTFKREFLVDGFSKDLSDGSLWFKEFSRCLSPLLARLAFICFSLLVWLFALEQGTENLCIDGVNSSFLPFPYLREKGNPHAFETSKINDWKCFLSGAGLLLECSGMLQAV